MNSSAKVLTDKIPAETSFGALSGQLWGTRSGLLRQTLAIKRGKNSYLLLHVEMETGVAIPPWKSLRLLLSVLITKCIEVPTDTFFERFQTRVAQHCLPLCRLSNCIIVLGVVLPPLTEL
ncbi:hypothetical protein BaRGS_00006290 [Batillaria attramentaria]|uniref:Uncharacterized protein n=1 Tax=Batillaria attramentaria TaxID=370345 RepID=A0ABD0LSB9_9CAEN